MVERLPVTSEAPRAQEQVVRVGRPDEDAVESDLAQRLWILAQTLSCRFGSLLARIGALMEIILPDGHSGPRMPHAGTETSSSTGC